MYDKILELINIKFEYPSLLLLIVVFVVCNKFCKAKTQSYYMPHLHMYKKGTIIKSTITNILKWLSIICSIVALTSPIKEHKIINTKKDGIDIVLNLDTSGSMRAVGFNQQNPQQNRWEAVKDIVNDFIDKRTNDNIALVVFASSVMTASALTYDNEALKKIIKSLNIGVVGQQTALIDSIVSSINILKNHKAKSKIIIALTDGEDTASITPLDIVIKMAKKHNIKIYTIAIGSTSVYTLQKLSQQTNGKFFQASNKQNLKLIYDTINKLEKSKIDQNKIILKEYYYFYPLMISFISLLFFVYLKNKKEV